ncbi:hypothetical protein [Candidatus Chloroploca sp. Khr17]|uniref:hypothetical protein n=1 Tax=Candidatus Chloroploca sp. Khr17 TaxID=2496869 RepID=UPI00101B8EB7|nr:hypothetical protein [Candidatus Chloroploca sp. Khr17]
MEKKSGYDSVHKSTLPGRRLTKALPSRKSSSYQERLHQMNRSITFRTQIAINTVTLCLVAFMLLASNTLANSNVANTVSSTATTTISYQGHLTNPDGTPVSATLPMTFNLYAAPTGGTAVWTEQRTGSNAVPVSNGLFNVALGSVTPIPVSLLNAPLWLGIYANTIFRFFYNHPGRIMPMLSLS